MLSQSKADKKAWELWHLKKAEIKRKTGVDGKETKEQRDKRIKRLLNDYRAFVNYYFPHYADSDCGDFQVDLGNEVKANKNIFAVAEWAREHAKSVHINVIIPLLLYAHKELDGMILGGKSERTASRLLGDIQAELLSNERYKSDFGVQVKKGDWAEGDFELDDGTFFIAVGRGQSPRGLRKREKRPNYASVDDIDDDILVKNEKRVDEVVDWILEALYGALSIKGARLIMAGNRIHKKSVLAKIVGDVDKGDAKREGIYHSKVNAIENGRPAWHQRYTLEELMQRIRVTGYRRSQKEYFNNPIVEGKIFKNDWIKWDNVPKLSEYDSIVAYFDPSFKSSTKNDYKAIRIWGKKGKYYYLLASFVRQCTISEAVRWAYSWYEDNIYDTDDEEAVVPFYMEANFIQDLLLEEFENEGEIRDWILPVRPDRRNKPDKTSRVENTSPLYERGLVIYDIRKKNDPDTQTGLEQLLAFDTSGTAHDDAPDADEGAFYILNKRTKRKKTKRRLGKRTPFSKW